MITNWDSIARAAEALDFPTSDAFAASLWRLLNSMTVDTSAALYRCAGYIPFCGFPLSRSGKFRTITREEAEEELDSNPLCKLDCEVTLFIRRTA